MRKSIASKFITFAASKALSREKSARARERSLPLIVDTKTKSSYNGIMESIGDEARNEATIMELLIIMLMAAGITLGAKGTFDRRPAFALTGILSASACAGLLVAPTGIAMALFSAAVLVGGGIWFYFKGADVTLFERDRR